MKKREIYQISLSGKVIKKWNSATEAAESLSLNRGNIATCCSGKLCAAYGFIWSFDLTDIDKKVSLASVTRSESQSKAWSATKEERLRKRRKTSMERFGVEHHMQLDSYKRKGPDNPVASESTRKKISETERATKMSKLLQRFGHLEFLGFHDGLLKFRGPCEHEFSINRQLLVVRSNNVHEICTICNDPRANQESEAQREIESFVSSIEGEYITNVKGILSGRKELDIYVPGKRFAIEYDGFKYHNTMYRPEDYHLQKTEECESKGIRLFHVFEDEWLFKKEIVKSMITNFLGFSEKIHARSCTVKELDGKTQVTFFESNHIQGGFPARESFGLYHGKTLVAAMSFSKPRAALGKRQNPDGLDRYELVRYCNVLGKSVVGGASRLLAHFERTHGFPEIYTYANRRWSNGNLYEKLGFSFAGLTKPNYWYFKDNARANRYNYRKDILVTMGYDSSKSEREIMEELGVPRIYDCGNMIFVKNPRSFSVSDHLDQDRQQDAASGN